MSNSANCPVIVAARRSPIGTAGFSLAEVGAADLAAPVLSAVLADARLGAETVQEVLLGNCMGPGGDVARVATLTAGLGHEVPALTLDRQCGSGLATVALAARLASGQPGIIVAGGVESASTAPWRFWPPRDGGEPVRYQRAPLAPEHLGDPDMGMAADLLAEQRQVSRRRQDQYAARSHALAVRSRDAGHFEAETIPVSGIRHDERPRSEFTVERLARLRPAFRHGGTVTVGNACGINDGAAAVTLVDAATHRRLAAPGLRVLATATAGVDPNRPGLGPVPAARQALHEAGLRLRDIDVVELNEAFASQVLACCDELPLDPHRVCSQGGALALGHPWGASGAVLVVRLFTQLVRQEAGCYGLAAIAVGGGQGVAMVVQRCP